VFWRKFCFGAKSSAVSLFVLRMLTVIETARRRGVNLPNWLEQAFRLTPFIFTTD
jgi:hypothetical protein